MGPTTRTVFALACWLPGACGSSTGLWLVADVAAPQLDAPGDLPQEPTGCPPPGGASSLPGVRYDLSGNRCEFTLAEAAAGIEFRYRTVVGGPVSEVGQPLDAGGCGITHDTSGLLTQELIGGGGQRYCDCDEGLCDWTAPTVSLVPGVYEAVFMWNGRNWNGSSDYGIPYGPPFPAGTYALTLDARGRYTGSDGVVRSYEVAASVEFQLVP